MDYGFTTYSTEQEALAVAIANGLVYFEIINLGMSYIIDTPCDAILSNEIYW